MSEKNFIQSSLSLIKSRKEALGLWIWCSGVASLLVGRGFPPLQPSFISILATAFIALAVYVYNDLIDMDADKLNVFKNNRPLPSGEVTRENALKLIYISSFIGLSLSFLNSFKGFLFHALFFILFSLYSYPKVHLKKLFLVKESVISLGLIIIGLSVNYAILESFSLMVFTGFLIFSIFAFFAIPTGFDSTDVSADMLQGVRTIASITSLKQRMQLAMGGMLIIMTITPFTYNLFGYNFLLPVSVLFVGLVFIMLLYPLMRKLDVSTSGVNRDTIMRARKIIVIFIFLICGCVILGSLNIGVLNIQ